MPVHLDSSHTLPTFPDAGPLHDEHLFDDAVIAFPDINSLFPKPVPHQSQGLGEIAMLPGLGSGLGLPTCAFSVLVLDFLLFLPQFAWTGTWDPHTPRQIVD